MRLTFGLNALIGKHNTEDDKKTWVGDWNPRNAMNLMKYTISKGYKIDSYELGRYKSFDVEVFSYKSTILSIYFSYTL